MKLLFTMDEALTILTHEVTYWMPLRQKKVKEKDGVVVYKCVFGYDPPEVEIQ